MLVGIGLCCNNKNGMTLNHIEGINLPNRLSLVGHSSFKIVEGGIKIAGKISAFHTYNWYVGNIFWDYAHVAPIVAANLLNHLKELNAWDCEEAREDFWEKWHSGDQFIEADFKPTPISNQKQIKA